MAAASGPEEDPMASFTITGSSTVARTLAGGESGVIAPANASLIVPGGVAVQMTNSSSIVVNYLLVNGTLIASGTSTIDKAVTSIGNSASIGIGPSGHVGTAAGYAFDLGGSAFVDFTNAGTVLANSNVAVRIQPNASFLNVFFYLNILWFLAYCSFVSEITFGNINDPENYILYRDKCVDGAYYELQYSTKKTK